MSFADCQGLQAAKPHVAVAGPCLFQHRSNWICFGIRQVQHLLPTSPTGTGSWEGGILKGKTPLWMRREGAFDEVSPPVQLILT